MRNEKIGEIIFEIGRISYIALGLTNAIVGPANIRYGGSYTLTQL